MGQLVFQATLGGQVNLVGPNTASTYNINVPAVAGNMVTTGDTGATPFGAGTVVPELRRREQTVVGLGPHAGRARI